MDVDAETAREVVRRFVASEGTDASDLTVEPLGDGAVSVSAGPRSWFVVPYPGDDHLRPDDRFALLEIAEPGIGDPGRRPDGYAVLPDGCVLHLAHATDLGRLWRHLGEGEPDVTFAALIARYLQAPGVERHQNLVLRRADLSDHLSDAQMDAVPVDELTVVGGPGGARHLTFDTFFLVPPGDHPAWTVGLNRWDVDAGPGELGVDVKPLASGLRSRRYSPPV